MSMYSGVKNRKLLNWTGFDSISVKIGEGGDRSPCPPFPTDLGLIGAEMPLQTLLVSNAKDLWLIALHAKALCSVQPQPGFQPSHGPLKIWVEYIIHYHFMKLQLRGAWEDHRSTLWINFWTSKNTLKPECMTNAKKWRDMPDWKQKSLHFLVFLVRFGFRSWSFSYPPL